MKKLLYLLPLLVIMLSLGGCNREDIAYNTGYLATMGWEAGKAKSLTDPDAVEKVELAYGIFKKAMDATTNVTEIKTKMLEAVEDVPEKYRDSVRALITRYWNSLGIEDGVENLKDSAAYEVLASFKGGVEDALADLELLKPATGGEVKDSAADRARIEQKIARLAKTLEVQKKRD